jgi:calcineurin-like phosphoesterase family protein
MRRLRVAYAIAFSISIACGPNLPPTTVPPPPNPALAPFASALKAYVDTTQPYRRQAAQAGERVPGKANATDGAEMSVRTRQAELADALKAKLRPSAQQGELFSSDVATAIRQEIDEAFGSPRHDLLMDALAEQNEAGKGEPKPVAINEFTDAPRVPPLLLGSLPPLPKQLEYAFSGRTLMIRDADAQVVVDYLPDLLPALPPAGPNPTPPQPVLGTAAPLPMPSLRGGLVFALIGDAGSGDDPQQAVAKAMLNYFVTARRFKFVLLLGDNLYDDDYTGEFSRPYKDLLDRGVKFYAALGNHDRDLQIHFKPFNMNDRDYYSFDDGNVRFAALNSNHPNDPAQLKWLDTVFADAPDKWRICFFHHPLYSSGRHAMESRDVIRPALEPALTRNRVHVVFSGHEHLYERIRAEKAIQYFVSGGGGRYLYDVRPSDFDEVAVSDHHFMVAQIAGDRMFFEAITPEQKVIDCGVVFRTTAAERRDDNDVRSWTRACNAAKSVPVRTDR